VSDDAVIAKAIEERRVFITEDRDFRQLVFAAAKPVCVILLRFPSAARASLPSAVADFIATHGAELDDRFVVMEPGRIRITRLS
jgi:predicted nuclease of predicted toxin-antitoxin system